MLQGQSQIKQETSEIKSHLQLEFELLNQLKMVVLDLVHQLTTVQMVITQETSMMENVIKLLLPLPQETIIQQKRNQFLLAIQKRSQNQRRIQNQSSSMEKHSIQTPYFSILLLSMVSVTREDLMQESKTQLQSSQMKSLRKRCLSSEVMR